MSKLSATLVQSSLIWEDKQANLNMFSDKLTSFSEKTDIIVLPEMFTTGFSMNVKALAEDMSGKTLNWMTDMAQKKNCAVTGSFIAKENGNFYNRLIWMNPDGSFEYYDKKHLFRMANEEAYYSSGSGKLIINYKGWKIRPLICYDLRFPVWSRNQYANSSDKIEADYDLLFYVANWPSVRTSAWDILLKARAVENQAYCIGVNRIGKDGIGKEYIGHTTAVEPKGSYLLDPVYNEDGLYTVVLDKEVLDLYRQKFPQGLDADRFDLTD